jgi:tetratricopeptide (TPR) repeat protein
VTSNDNALQDLEGLFEKLGSLPDEPSREAFLVQHPDSLDPAVVMELAEAVRTRVRVDVPQALRLAEAAVVIARKLGDADALGRSLRSKANALYMLGRNQAAVEHHEQALKAFEQIGNDFEIAISSSASLQPLILLGEYDHALAASERARKIFTSLKAERRLARLDINTSNIFHRQDRFEEALSCYERAYEQLVPHEDAEGIAVVLSNLAVCLISLNDFARALDTHQRAREFCQHRGMPLLAAQADYNIAYLYYLRGEYTGRLRCCKRAANPSGLWATPITWPSATSTFPRFMWSSI